MIQKLIDHEKANLEVGPCRPKGENGATCCNKAGPEQARPAGIKSGFVSKKFTRDEEQSSSAHRETLVICIYSLRFFQIQNLKPWEVYCI